MANLIDNGSFVGHADGWWPESFGMDPVAHVDADTRSPGSGAMRLARGAAGNAFVAWRPGGARLNALGAETEIDVVAYVRSDDPVTAQMQFSFRFDAEGIAPGQAHQDSAELAGGAEWVELAVRGVAVPPGATHFTFVVGAFSNSGGVDAMVDDVYVGAAGGESAPYAGADVAGVPALRGAWDFEAATAATFWSGWWGDETIARDAVDPIAGTASLSVATTGEGEEGAYWFWNFGFPPVAPGETVPFAFTLRGSGTVRAALWMTGDPFEVWSGALSGTPQRVSVDVEIPAGMWLASPLFQVDPADQEVEFWVDDVVLGTPPGDDAPPARPCPGLALRLGIGL